jgi:hypothetical protein
MDSLLKCQLFTYVLIFFFFSSCCSTSEHRASVKRFFFSMQFLILRQSVGLLEGGISLRQGRYVTQTEIHALSGIRTHDPSVRAGEDISCLDRAATAIGYVLEVSREQTFIVSEYAKWRPKCSALNQEH